LVFQCRCSAKSGKNLLASSRVSTLLSNIIGNALKFTPADGRVALSVDRQGAIVRFSVVDTGPGIRRESLAHIFDRFWKDETPGRRAPGSDSSSPNASSTRTARHDDGPGDVSIGHLTAV
jgi:signal transduction histidine kinase